MHKKSFALGRGREPAIEADKIERRRPPFGGEKRRGELECINSAQRIYPKEAPCSFQNSIHRFDAAPAPGESIKTFKGHGRATVAPSGVNRFSRSAREMADAHSTGVPHQTIVPGSLR